MIKFSNSASAGVLFIFALFVVVAVCFAGAATIGGQGL